MQRETHDDILSVTLDLGWGTHLRNHLIDFGLGDAGLKVMKACTRRGITDLHRFLLFFVLAACTRATHSRVGGLVGKWHGPKP